MVSLPNHIAVRIRQIIDANGSGKTIDDAARDYGAIALMGTIGSLWMMRPDGTLWDVDLDWGKPFAPLPDELHITALVAGAERFPWLTELLPERPATARDCPVCKGRGLLFPKEFVSLGSGIFCPECKALGWLQLESFEKETRWGCSPTCGCTGREPLRYDLPSSILQRVAVRAGEPQGRQTSQMDFLALLGALFEIGGALPGRRVTVEERYEMKRKVRELQKREREAAQNKPTTANHERERREKQSDV